MKWSTRAALKRIIGLLPSQTAPPRKGNASDVTDLRSVLNGSSASLLLKSRGLHLEDAKLLLPPRQSWGNSHLIRMAPEDATRARQRRAGDEVRENRRKTT